MNDKNTIYRQAAIDSAKEGLCDFFGLHADDIKFPITNTDYLIFALNKNITSRISSLPSAEPEQRWIPVTEKLPKKSGRYIVTRGLNACDALWNRVYILNYSDLMGLNHEKIWWDGNVGKSDFTKYEDVTAWMPLPKPWKGEENE